MVLTGCLFALLWLSDPWEVDLSENHQVFSPALIAVAANDWVAVVDRENNRILFFSADGKFRQAIGRKGKGPGEFEWVSGIFPLSDPGGILVLDNLVGRVTLIRLPDFKVAVFPFSLPGHQIGLNQAFLSENIAFTLALEPQKKSLIRYHIKSREFSALFDFPNEKHPGQSINLGGQTIQTLYRWHPNHLFAVGSGVAAVANSGEPKVTVIDLKTGKTTQSFNLTLPRLAVTAADKDEAILSAPKPYQAAMVSQLSRPDFWPVLADMVVSVHNEVFAIGHGRNVIPVFFCHSDGTVAEFQCIAKPIALSNGFAYVQVEDGDRFTLKKTRLKPR